MTTATALPRPTTEVATPARVVRPIPTARLTAVELRKMFDTRAGFWLMASVGIVSVLATAAVIRELGEKSSSIDQIVGAISDIAQQTNMLALNASIEAARAGDAGRGQSLIVWAIAEGRACAAAVDQWLMGSTRLPAPVAPSDRSIAVL